MYVLIQYEVGVVIEGVVLANEKDRLRVAVPGLPDTLELMLSDSGWIADDQHVEIEFLMPRHNDFRVAEMEMPRSRVRAIALARTN